LTEARAGVILPEMTKGPLLALLLFAAAPLTAAESRFAAVDAAIAEITKQNGVLKRCASTRQELSKQVRALEWTAAVSSAAFREALEECPRQAEPEKALSDPMLHAAVVASPGMPHYIFCRAVALRQPDLCATLPVKGVNPTLVLRNCQDQYKQAAFAGAFILGTPDAPSLCEQVMAAGDPLPPAAIKNICAVLLKGDAKGACDVGIKSLAEKDRAAASADCVHSLRALLGQSTCEASSSVEQKDVCLGAQALRRLRDSKDAGACSERPLCRAMRKDAGGCGSLLKVGLCHRSSSWIAHAVEKKARALELQRAQLVDKESAFEGVCANAKASLLSNLDKASQLLSTAEPRSDPGIAARDGELARLGREARKAVADYTPVERILKSPPKPVSAAPAAAPAKKTP
jgi:hypothetical protein